MTTTTTTAAAETPPAPPSGSRLRTVLAVSAIPTACVVIPTAIVLAELSRPPRRDVPGWLHVTATDLTQLTFEIQAALVGMILVLGAHAVLLAKQHAIAHAAKALSIGVYLVTCTLFLSPPILAGTHSLPTFDGDPIPYSTDFDYNAYLPDLLPAVVAPAVWALAAAIPLGLALSTVDRFCSRRRQSAQSAGTLSTGHPVPAPLQCRATTGDISEPSSWQRMKTMRKQYLRLCQVTLARTGRGD